MTATPLIFDFRASFRQTWTTGSAAAQALKLAGLTPDAMGEQITAAVHAAPGELAGDGFHITAGLSVGRRNGFRTQAGPGVVAGPAAFLDEAGMGWTFDAAAGKESKVEESTAMRRNDALITFVCTAGDGQRTRYLLAQ